MGSDALLCGLVAVRGYSNRTGSCAPTLCRTVVVHQLTMPGVLSVPPKITVAEGEAVRRALRLFIRGAVGSFYPTVRLPFCGPVDHCVLLT